LGPITLQEQDAFGNPTTVAETVNLTSNSTGTFHFATTSGGANVSTVSIPSGSSSVSFYYGDTKAGTATITASGSLASTFQYEFVTAGAAAKVAITATPSTGATAQSTTDVSLALQLQDQFGNATTSTGTTTLGLSTTGNGFFATTNGASGSATINATFTNGVGTATLYYGDGVLFQSTTVTAKNGSTTWGTTSVTMGV
jgi:hypothetical protein